MSTSSSEESSGTVAHSATSSGVESTGSLLFSVPSDFSDVQTEITPPASPTPSEGKMRTPRDILDASRRLGQISISALQGDATPTKPPKQQLRLRAPSKSPANDETGYDADRDVDVDEDEGGDKDKGAGAGAGTNTTTRPIRRPAFLRIDTRQHRRVASMLATRRPSPGFGDMDAYTGMISHPLRAKLAPLSAIRLKPSATSAPTASVDNVESYELRPRPRPRVELVGLGIGFPENHPLRSRAFTMPSPMPTSDNLGLPTGREAEPRKERRSEWFPSPAWLKKTVQVGLCAPSPVRLAPLRPTFLEVSPSPIDYLPPPPLPTVTAVAGVGTLRREIDVHDRSEARVSELDHENRRTMDTAAHDAEIGRERYDNLLAWEELLELDDVSESKSAAAVTLPTANSEITMSIFRVGSHGSCLSQGRS